MPSFFNKIKKTEYKNVSKEKALLKRYEFFELGKIWAIQNIK